MIRICLVESQNFITIQQETEYFKDTSYLSLFRIKVKNLLRLLINSLCAVIPEWVILRFETVQFYYSLWGM